ncbi:ABC transporter ATP-binding protein [Selenomonas sputigena]|uniref:ABC transporter, ATP-binding protein n=1 Tax=Selenomonas sputigena (strain ATCC 35185 / DSM 20758 / CCUG 44933 / VPI D19B-28) TaxID=546271 RepID=C9LUY4_SELS3|nr:ABC transporter ATP-binding protein [Selenomonas sputigena]AEC01197.1 Sulfate-transporting ATPase [Selenomonas sputigena ATCC 35185]EEX77338.1 ABC transporter, ATP-binding protein [Selenomonas sputigena ATCC 35185]
MSTKETVIAIAGVSCSRKGKKILEDVTLDVESGTVMGLLGPNGAGKTTLIRLVAGLARPDAGTIHVCGEDAAKRSVHFRRLIGLVPQENTLESELTVGESLLAYARLYGIKDAKEMVHQTAERYHLSDFLDKRPEEISGGMKRRAVIARAAMTDPAVLLLDEPSAGLDPDLRQEVWALIRKLRDAGKTLLLTTHYMEEAERLCGRIAFLRAGRLRALDTADGIRAAAGDAKDLEQAFLRLSHEEECS